MNAKTVTIIGHSKYTVTDDGVIFSLYKNRVLPPHDNAGYKMVFLKNDQGISKWQYVHRLVAAHFITIPDVDKELWVNHKDGNKSNNNVDNLEWTTISENIKHAYRTGLKSYNRKQRAHLYLCILPDNSSYTYSELRQKHPNDYKKIYNRCVTQTQGHYRIIINHRKQP